MELAKKLNFQYINLNDYAIKNKLTKRNKTDYTINDLNLFSKKIKKKIENGNFIMISVDPYDLYLNQSMNKIYMYFINNISKKNIGIILHI